MRSRNHAASLVHPETESKGFEMDGGQWAGSLGLGVMGCWGRRRMQPGRETTLLKESGKRKIRTGES
jgi:hypothetical protein